MELVRSGSGHYVYDAAGVVAEFRVEIVCQHAKFGDGIQVWNDASATVHLLLNVGSIHKKTIGVFALPTDRLIAGIKIARGRNRYSDAGHDDRIGRLR